MKEKLVSIIVPVYNTELYIEKCIRSIMEQTYKNIEIIIIDDGSTDKSGELVDKLKEEDERIYIFHNENRGVSYARNYGINMAKGDYIYCVDSDDYITNNTIEVLTDTIIKNGSDLVVCGYYNDYIEEKNVIRQNDNTFFQEKILLTRDEYLNRMSEHIRSLYYGVLWNKLYKRSVIKKHNLLFREEISLGEDFLFNLDYLEHIENVIILPDYLYHHCYLREDSLTKKVDSWYEWNMTKLRLDYCIEKYKNIGVYNICKKNLQKAMSIELIAPTYFIVENKQYTRKQAIEQLKIIYENEINRNALYEVKGGTVMHKIAKFSLRWNNYNLFYFAIKLLIKIKNQNIKKV